MTLSEVSVVVSGNELVLQKRKSPVVTLHQNEVSLTPFPVVLLTFVD